MKSLILILIAVFCQTAMADGLSAHLDGLPESVTVTKDGVEHTYGLSSSLNTAYIWGNNQNLTISHDGLSSMCGNYLGTLNAPIAFRMRTDEGIKVVTVDPARTTGRISVFGVCSQDNPDVLTQLQFDIKGDDVGTFLLENLSDLPATEQEGEESASTTTESMV